jgi:hypothetical protein
MAQEAVDLVEVGREIACLAAPPTTVTARPPCLQAGRPPFALTVCRCSGSTGRVAQVHGDPIVTRRDTRASPEAGREVALGAKVMGRAGGTMSGYWGSAQPQDQGTRGGGGQARKAIAPFLTSPLSLPVRGLGVRVGHGVVFVIPLTLPSPPGGEGLDQIFCDRSMCHWPSLLGLPGSSHRR